MFGHSAKKGNYPYAVTRVKAKKAKLLKEDDFDKMLQMSLPEISRYISEAGYGKEMNDLAGKMQGVDLIEYATYRGLASAFESILRSAEGELYDMVYAYLAKWDIWNFKVILRGKTYGLDHDTIREDLVPAGSLSAESLEELLAIDSIEETISAYAKMKGIHGQDLLNAYSASEGRIGSVEDYLDKLYYSRLLDSIVPSSTPTKLFQDYVRSEIDIRNVETILKLKVEGIYGEGVMQYIIPDGKQISMKVAAQLANAESVSAIASDLSRVEFFEDIKDFFDSENPSVRDVVLAMRKFEISHAKKFSHLYPLSVVPVLDFMIHKELEVSNIRTVSRGIESGLDKETIKGLLVI